MKWNLQAQTAKVVSGKNVSVIAFPDGTVTMQVPGVAATALALFLAAKLSPEEAPASSTISTLDELRRAIEASARETEIGGTGNG